MPLSPFYRDLTQERRAGPRIQAFDDDMQGGALALPPVAPPMGPELPPEPAPEELPPQASAPAPAVAAAAPSPMDEKQQYFELLRKKYEGDVTRGEADYNENRMTREDLDRTSSAQNLNTLLGGLSDSAAQIGNYRGQAAASDVGENGKALNANLDGYVKNRQGLAEQGQKSAQAGRLGIASVGEGQQKYAAAVADFERKKKAATNENLMRDPNSPISAEYRAIMKEAGFPAPENASAYMLQATKYGDLVKEKWNKEQERAFRAEQAGLERGARDERAAADRTGRMEAAKLLAESRRDVANTAAESRKELAAGKSDKEKRAEGDRLRTQYNADPIVKQATQLKTLNTQLDDLAKNPTGASDQALITLFTKSLDPTSVVRESEFALSANNAGVINRYEQLYDKAKSGRQLTPEQRTEMVTTAKTIAVGLEREAAEKRQFYTDLAADAGVEAWKVIGREGSGMASSGGGGAPSNVGSAPGAPAPSGGRAVYDPDSYGGRTATGGR